VQRWTRSWNHYYAVAPLTEYAWKFCYPGEEEEPTHDEAKEAFAMACEVYNAILARLSK
jgi:hypothetical protein